MPFTGSRASSVPPFPTYSSAPPKPIGCAATGGAISYVVERAPMNWMVTKGATHSSAGVGPGTICSAAPATTHWTAYVERISATVDVGNTIGGSGVNTAMSFLASFTEPWLGGPSANRSGGPSFQFVPRDGAELAAIGRGRFEIAFDPVFIGAEVRPSRTSPGTPTIRFTIS